MACVTRGSPVTSPILPGEIEERLPPLTDYTLPEDGSGMTDVRVWDHQARTLQVAVWLHRLDMALSEEPAASGSLVQAQHSPGCLLAYFLAPGTTWSLQFEDIERSRNLDRSFRNIYIIPSFPTREQHAHSVQNARSRFTKLNQ